MNGYNGVAASLGWGRRDKSLLIFHPRITLKCDCQEQLTSTKCHSTLPSVCLSVRSAGGGSGGSESDAMDTDLGEKTVTSSTVLSGGDEVCVCMRACIRVCVCVHVCVHTVCVCALPVRVYVYSFHTRMHAHKSVAKTLVLVRCWYICMHACTGGRMASVSQFTCLFT